MESGKLLKHYRQLRNMTQAELAERAGYKHKTAISKIETGAVEMTQRNIKLFADILGISPADLIDGAGRSVTVNNTGDNNAIAAGENCTATVGDGITTQERELIETFRSLSLSDQYEVLNFMFRLRDAKKGT